MRDVARLVFLTSLILLAGALPARAQPLHTGFVDNAAFYNVDAQVGNLWLTRAREAGLTFVRINVYWDSVAPLERPPGFEPANPADPAYNWNLLDQSIKSSVSNGLTPMLMAFLAPRWAEGPNRDPNARLGTWKPDPQQFAEFGKALAMRYSGDFPDPSSPGVSLPKVDFFQAWNEPNLMLYLNPQAAGGNIVSPDNYREILAKFYSAVKSVRSDVKVIAAGLAPIGRPNNAVLAPKEFIRRLTCMRTNTEPRRNCDAFVRADIWDAHPFTSGGPTHEGPTKDDISLGDLPELKSLIRAADRHEKIRGMDRRTPIWATEFSWDTKPDPGGLPMPLARRWTAEALYQMWRSGISVMTWLSILDAPPPFANLGWGDLAQSGFYYFTKDAEYARAKSSLQAFRFPFVALKNRKRFRFWGRTPNSGAGTVRIQVRSGSRWKTVIRAKADQDGIFRNSVRTNMRGGYVRAIYRSSKSVPFSLKSVPDRFFRPFGG